MKIGCIGIGNMGSAIMKSVCAKYKSDKSVEIFVTNRTFEKAKKFAAENGCIFVGAATEEGENHLSANQNIAKMCDVLFLAVKPNMIESVLYEIKDFISGDKLLISMAAGVSLENLERTSAFLKFIRIMPNLPAKISQSMTALCHNDNTTDDDVKIATEILESCGKVEVVPENMMDCVTAISGSGPAYAFIFIEALADAAVGLGMPRAQAYIYAAQTLKGSAELVLESGLHPAVLKDSVCSPAGTTIEAVKSLEENGFRNAIMQAVKAAYKKAWQCRD